MTYRYDLNMYYHSGPEVDQGVMVMNKYFSLVIG